MPAYLTDDDGNEVTEIRMPRGAGRTYTLTVENDDVRESLTAATIFATLKADVDDSVELFRWSSGVAIGSIGRIATVAVANLIDGETFELDDGVNAAVEFEFDVAGDGAAGAGEVIDVSALTTADEVRDKVISVLNATALFNITASELASGQVRLRGLDASGATGNTTSSDAVADTDFVVTNMIGGVDDAFEISVQAGATEGQAVWTLSHPSTEDLDAPRDYVFSIWVLLADGRADAEVDNSDFIVDKRVPIYVP